MFVAPAVNGACPDSLLEGLAELHNPFPPLLKERGLGVSSSEITSNKFVNGFLLCFNILQDIAHLADRQFRSTDYQSVCAKIPEG
jgi:hypothetical protein